MTIRLRSNRAIRAYDTAPAHTLPRQAKLDTWARGVAADLRRSLRRAVVEADFDIVALTRVQLEISRLNREAADRARCISYLQHRASADVTAHKHRDAELHARRQAFEQALAASGITVRSVLADQVPGVTDR